MLVAVAAVGAYVFNGGFDDWGDSSSSTVPDGTSPWGLPDASSGGSDDRTGAGSPSAGGGSTSSGGSDRSNGGGGSESPTLPGDDHDGAGPGSGGGDSGTSSSPATVDHIYDGPRVNGFYTGDISVWPGHHPDTGTKVSGSGLRTGITYAVSVDADVTDHGLQWFKDGAILVNSNNDPTNTIKEWIAVDTSVVMVLEIHSDRAIDAPDVSVSGVWGKQLVVGDPSGGPWVRSQEQVDPSTVRVFLAFQPYTASSSAGAFQGPLSLASSNGSIEEFNDKGALAAYAPMKIHFNAPGNYGLSFYLAKLDANAGIEYRASPTATVSVSVAGKD